MKNEDFLQELEERLAENRRIAERSVLPSFLQPLASYLGFHTFRVLFLTSLALTIAGFLFFDRGLLAIGKQIFFYR